MDQRPNQERSEAPKELTNSPYVITPDGTDSIGPDFHLGDFSNEK